MFIGVMFFKTFWTVKTTNKHHPATIVGWTSCSSTAPPKMADEHASCVSQNWLTNKTQIVTIILKIKSQSATDLVGSSQVRC